MANKGKRMLFEEDYEYLQEVIKNNPDPSDIGGSDGIVITITEIPTTLSANDLKALQDNMNTRIKYDNTTYLQYNRLTNEYNDLIYLRNYKTSTTGDHSDCLIMWNSIRVDKNGYVVVDNSENRNTMLSLKAGTNIKFTYSGDSVTINDEITPNPTIESGDTPTVLTGLAFGRNGQDKYTIPSTLTKTTDSFVITYQDNTTETITFLTDVTLS